MEKKICPECGKEYSSRPALSRKDNKTMICPKCGMMDALDTDANTILGIKEKDEESVDERLKELNPKMKETLTELFLRTIEGVEKIN